MQFASFSPDPQNRSGVIYAFSLSDDEQRLWNAASSRKRSAFQAAIRSEDLTFRSCEKGRLRVVTSPVDARQAQLASHIQELLMRMLEHLK